MNCLQKSVEQTIKHAYAHHIQRLMVIGNFCLLAGIKPQEVCEWYLIVYVDALEWAELPNTLGMSQYGDGGSFATKPYVSSGKYIERMSNYCGDCHYNPKTTLEANSCPFNYLYWDFLQRHWDVLRRNTRMALALKNLARKSEKEKKGIAQQVNSFLHSGEMIPYEA
jgi:deoxyribodipyrimidine photolyase-related protein